MKKQFLVIFILIIAISSCERDDICIDDITPNFVTAFFDIDETTSVKAVTNLSIKILGIENDSITILSDTITSTPLKVSENSTTYIFTLNSTGDSSTDETIKLNRDTITVNYITEEVFVGRACGFKSIFNNVDYILKKDFDADTWIKSIEVVTDTIKDETAAHVKIFH